MSTARWGASRVDAAGKAKVWERPKKLVAKFEGSGDGLPGPAAPQSSGKSTASLRACLWVMRLRKIKRESKQGRDPKML